MMSRSCKHDGARTCCRHRCEFTAARKVGWKEILVSSERVSFTYARHHIEMLANTNFKQDWSSKGLNT